MGDNKRIKALAEQAQLMPQEELLAVQKRKNNLTISIPKETSFQEKRVALTPEAVGLLVNNGHIVLVEASAGKESHFSDTDYSEAGAQIVHEREKIFQSEIIFKVAPPSLEEVKMMSGNQFLFSALQMTLQPKESLEVLMKKKVTAIAWDYIKDSEDIYPVVRAMGEIAGNTSVLIASEYLSNANNGQGLMFGGISGVHPTEVVIIGAGTVGAYASKAALGMGCSVKIFDNSLFKLRRLQNDVGHR
ncbi:MAG: alanine dehydrogenase, partial [Flavobacteriales bacterium]